jgi:hypothetical protein
MVVAGCVLLAAVAVLDVGSPTVEAAPTASLFAGSWSGTWSITDGPFGTFDWTISDAGQIKGRVYSIPADHGGEVVGHVGADGKLRFTGMAPGDSPSEDGNGFPFKGTALIDGDGKLVASARLHANDWSLVAILERN